MHFIFRNQKQTKQSKQNKTKQTQHNRIQYTNTQQKMCVCGYESVQFGNVFDCYGDTYSSKCYMQQTIENALIPFPQKAWDFCENESYCNVSLVKGVNLKLGPAVGMDIGYTAVKVNKKTGEHLIVDFKTPSGASGNDFIDITQPERIISCYR